MESENKHGLSVNTLQILWKQEPVGKQQKQGTSISKLDIFLLKFKRPCFIKGILCSQCIEGQEILDGVMPFLMSKVIKTQDYIQD